MAARPRLPLVVLMGVLALLLVGETRASSGGSSSNPSHQQPDITAFTFQRNSISNDDAPHVEMEMTNNTNDDNTNNDNAEESSIAASSLLYDGGCVVSAEAIMCTGGQDASSNYYTAHHDTSSSSMFGVDVDTFEDEESDDDDDDDNDGHSSMLSNASLRRRTKVGTTSCSSSYDKQPPKEARPRGGTRSPSTNAFLRKKKATSLGTILSSTTTTISSSSSSISALSIRGGAGVGDLGSELAKKLLVTALVTLVFEAMIGHELEFIKIRMQTAPDGTSYRTVFKSITSDKGIVALWDGFIPWGVIQSIFKGSVFGLAHAIASSLLVPLAEQGTIPMPLALTLAGGIGGGFQGFVLSPTLLLKTRVMTSDVFRERMSLAKTTWMSAKIGYDVVAKEGVGALMKGAGVFSTKRVFDWASRYFFSDLFETLAVNYKGGALTLTEKIWCSLLGGTASTVVTLPLDVLVAKMQDAKKADSQSSALNMFQDELREKGWGGLKKSYMKGFEARLLHVALTTVAIKTGVPITNGMIFPPQAAAQD